MAEVALKYAVAVDLSRDVPPTAQSVLLKITVSPPGGALFVSSQATNLPVRFDGPQATKRVPLGDRKVVYLQGVQGATNFNHEVLGWEGR